MDILNHEQVDLNRYSQVVAALNKATESLKVIAEDIQDDYPSLRKQASPAIKSSGNHIGSQIKDFIEFLEGYRSLYIGEGVDYNQFQKVAISEAKREKLKEAEMPVTLESDDEKLPRRAAGRRCYYE